MCIVYGVVFFVNVCAKVIFLYFGHVVSRALLVTSREHRPLCKWACSLCVATPLDRIKQYCNSNKDYMIPSVWGKGRIV